MIIVEASVTTLNCEINHLRDLGMDCDTEAAVIALEWILKGGKPPHELILARREVASAMLERSVFGIGNQ